MISLKKIRAYRVEHALALMRGETGFAEGEYIMRPFVPGVTLTLDMFSSKSTFAGGETYQQINSDTMARRFDEGTGETVGVYRIELEIPEDEDSYCFRYTLDQHSKYGSTISFTKANNGTAYMFAHADPTLYVARGNQVDVKPFPIIVLPIPPRAPPIYVALSSITRHAEEGKEQNNGTYPCLGEISFSFTTYRQEIDVHECRSGTAIGEFDVTWVTNGASMGSATAEKSITVISRPVSVRVTKESEVGCDQTVMMEAEVTPAAAKDSTITWSIVSGGEFAEFKAGDANLTGIKPGTVKVVAEYKENPSDWYAESVKSPEFTVEVVPAVRITGVPEIEYDREAIMQASGTPKGGTYKEWQIVNGNGDDGTIEINSESGKIKGTGLGTVTVKVNYEYDGETYESPPYQVKVVPHFNITQVSQVRHGESETMKVEVKPEEGEFVAWRILEAKDIITLEESNGKVTGKNLGIGGVPSIVKTQMVSMPVPRLYTTRPRRQARFRG